jgi:hypothetical protein
LFEEKVFAPLFTPLPALPDRVFTALKITANTQPNNSYYGTTAKQQRQTYLLQ